MRYLIFLILTISLPLASTCYAGDIVTDYLVWGASFTTAQKNAVKNYGRQDDVQPGMKTLFHKYDFGDELYRLRVTTRNATENNWIVNNLDNGKIQKMSSWELVTEFDGRQMQTFVGNRQTYMEEPKPFEVEITTP